MGYKWGGYMKLVIAILAWLWSLSVATLGVRLFKEGHVALCVLAFASALLTLPIFWSMLSRYGFIVKVRHRIFAAIATFVAIPFGMVMSGVPEPFAGEGMSLPELEAKLGEHSIIEMDRYEYPELFSKLFADGFVKANSLAKWAGITAAMSERCAPKVDIVAVSDLSTREEIQWFVDCENGERFQITEAQARRTRAEFEVKPTNVEVAQSTPIQPNSAALDDVSEVKVVSGCDRMVKAAMKSRGSYDASWSYDFRRHPTQGRVSVTREFEAQNSFGATLSSEYVCIVDAKSMTPLSIRIKEATGWETIYTQ